MVANLTVGKKKYAEAEPEVKEHLEKMVKLQAEFTALADDDAKVFAPLAKAYSLPSETEEQKAYKAEVMETNLLAASAVPLQIMEKSIMNQLEIISLFKQFVSKGK